MNTIRIYSPEFTLLHEFEDFISCKEQRNYAEASTIQLSVQPESTAAPYLLDGFYVCIDDWFYIIRDRIADTNRVSVVGFSPFKLLQQRVANEQTVSGSVDSMAKTLITANTQGNRSLPIVCAAADNSGTQHTWTTERNRVNYEIEDMLKLNDSGVKTKFIGDGFEFDTYQGANRSAENTEGNEPVIFAVKYDNLLSFSHETGNVDTVNVVYVQDDEGNVSEYDPDGASGVERFESTARENTTFVNQVSRLPEGYIELEYIEITNGQYLKTGYLPNQNTTIEMDIMPISVGTNGHMFVFGGAQDNKNQAFEFYSYGSSYESYYGNSVVTPGSVEWNAKTHIVHEKNKISITTDSATITGTHTENSFTSPRELYLFALNRPTFWSGGAFRAYKTIIREDNIFFRNYVPCKKTSGEVGLYDLIYLTFYSNAGPGTFVAGPEKTNVTQNVESAALIKPRNAITSTIAPYTFVYGADYFLGDIVTIENKSMEAVKHGDEYDIAEITRRHAVRITSMAIDYTADTVTYTPTFGTVQRDLRTVIKKQQKDIISNQTAIKAMNKRITALEAAI